MNKQKLIALIIKKQTYKDTKPIQTDIFRKKQQAVAISISAISHILKDDYNAEAKLYALRVSIPNIQYLKDCFEKGNQSFIAKVQSKILPLLVKIVKDSQSEKQIMKYGGSYTKSAELQKFKSIVTSLFTMCKQCIQKWANWMPDVDRQFVKMQKQVANIGENPWKNGFSYFREQNQTIFRQNCQKNGLKLVSSQKISIKQQLNSPIQKLLNQLPPRQAKQQPKLEINSTISVAQSKKKQNVPKQKYKSMAKIGTILKNSQLKLNKNQYFSKKQLQQTEAKFNAAVNEYIQEASQFDENYLQAKIQEFETIKQQNQIKAMVQRKKDQENQDRKLNPAKVQKEQVIKTQSKIKQPAQQKNTKQIKQKTYQQPIAALQISQPAIQHKTQTKQNNKNIQKIKDTKSQQSQKLNKLQDRQNPTFKKILDEKSIKPQTMPQKSNTFAPAVSVANSTNNAKPLAKNMKQEQPQIVIHSPKLKQLQKNKQLSKNTSMYEIVNTNNIKNNKDIIKKQKLQQQEQRVNFTQSDEEYSQSQSRSLIKKQRKENNTNIYQNISKYQPKPIQKSTAKFIREQQFQPIKKPISENNLVNVKPMQKQSYQNKKNTNLGNDIKVKQSYQNKTPPNTSNISANPPLASLIKLQQPVDDKKQNPNSNNNSLNNSHFTMNSQAKIQQITRQYEFQTEQLHKRIYFLQKQIKNLRQNQQKIKQGLKINQVGSRQIQFLKKRLQKEEIQKLHMEKQMNNLTSELKKISHQFEKSKQSWKSFDQASVSAKIKNDQNNLSHRPSQLSKSSYKLKKIKPIVVLQNQYNILKNDFEKDKKINILPIQQPLHVNALHMRIDQDYVNNMTHYEKIGSWLSLDNILRFRLCILGVSEEFYKDQNITMFKMQNLFSQNGAQFLKMTFMYHFRRLQQFTPKVIYKNIPQIDFWTKPIGGQKQIYSQQTICRLCQVPIKIMKSTISYNNLNNNTSFLLPFLFYNFLRLIQFDAQQFKYIFASRSNQTIKSKVIHLDSHIASTTVDFCNIFKQSKLNNQFLEMCLVQQAEDKAYMTQIQLLRNQKAVIRVLTIPSHSEMTAKAKELVNNLVFLLSAK